jgi:hypothetical protein
MNHKDAYNRAIKMNKFPKQFNRDNLNLANCYLDLVNKTTGIAYEHDITAVHTDHPMRVWDRTCAACNPDKL